MAPFDQQKRTLVLAEAIVFASLQLKPPLVFKTQADFIRSHRTEVPSYNRLAGIVMEAFKELDKKLALLITEYMDEELKCQLDTLLTVAEVADVDSGQKPFLLTVLKRSKEVMKPIIIKATIAEYVLLKKLYQACSPVVKVLAPTKEMIEYYAGFVLRAQVFQINQQEKRK